MAKVVTMGEIMLRLSTQNFERFLQADEFDVCYGGGEANVARRANPLRGLALRPPFGFRLTTTTSLPTGTRLVARSAIPLRGMDAEMPAGYLPPA